MAPPVAELPVAELPEKVDPTMLKIPAAVLPIAPAEPVDLLFVSALACTVSVPTFKTAPPVLLELVVRFEPAMVAVPLL